MIIFLATTGILLFLLFAWIAMQGPPGKTDPTAVLAVRQMADLKGLSFPGINRLLNLTEWETIRSCPELYQVAVSFRIERQALTLLWLSSLGDDVKSLWRFRRFLVRSGISVKRTEEVRIFFTAISALAFLSFLKMFIRIVGPFTFTGATRSARRLVETMSYTSAELLIRMPRAVWPEIERGWSKNTA